MNRWGWKPYVPVAKRRSRADRAAAQANKAGVPMQPVSVTGRAIATTFWGKAWCSNLEAYGDYANRLPRGRSYVRSGAVLDLVIEPGKVCAQVMGSRLYHVEISIAPVPQSHWQRLRKACAGSIASLIELLQGRLSQAVMQPICAPEGGLFPKPKEIRFACDCPDWANMCKHVAAALYGVGARLDSEPALLFTLRGVSAEELVTEATLPVMASAAPAQDKVLAEADLASVFGIELDAPTAPATKTPRRCAQDTGAEKPKPAAKKPAKAAVRPAQSAPKSARAAKTAKEGRAAPIPPTSGRRKTSSKAT